MQTGNDMSVFLSYCRKDAAVCEMLHSNLELQGLDVKIDIEDIPIGENIAESIAELIKNSACSVIVISEHSLKSVWVIWEIQRRQELLAKSKLIPVYLDKTFLDDEFVKVAHTQVQDHIKQLAKEAYEYSLNNTSSEHLDSQKQKLQNLNANFSQLINFIRSVNAVDLRTENYLDGFKKLYQAITGNQEFKNNIITPPQHKNTDINLRISEIEKLLFDYNIKEAINRTMDFIKDFCETSTDNKKRIIKISAKAHIAEAKVSEAGELIKINDEIIEEILDLVYPFYPQAA